MKVGTFVLHLFVQFELESTLSFKFTDLKVWFALLRAAYIASPFAEID